MYYLIKDECHYIPHLTDSLTKSKKNKNTLMKMEVER